MSATTRKHLGRDIEMFSTLPILSFSQRANMALTSVVAFCPFEVVKELPKLCVKNRLQVKPLPTYTSISQLPSSGSSNGTECLTSQS